MRVFLGGNRFGLGLFTGNTVRGWRHALSADKATVIASQNTVSDYWQVGMRINEPSTPAIAIGNVFQTDSGHAGVAVTGAQGIVEDNRVEKSAKNK